MNVSVLRVRTVAARGVRLALLVAILLSLAPALPVRAQEAAGATATPAVEVPPSLIELLEQAPKVPRAIVGEDGFAPDAAAAAAGLPDRTQYAVIDYTVEGNIVNATVQLPASQATFIASGQPDTNFGGLAQLNLGWDQSGPQAMRTLLQYDLSPLPSNVQINSAAFFINQTLINPPGDGQSMDFRAQLMQQNWNAGSVTWNNANFLGGTAFPLGSIPPAIGWISGPATDVVRAWDSGTPNRGLLITGDETPTLGRWRRFNGRQISALAPFLEVNYTGNCDTAPPVATMNALPTFSPQEFRVFWSAFDPAQPGCPASGVAWYNVRFRVNGGGWVNWRNQTSTDNFGFRREAPNGSTVEFQVQAADNAGNLGAWSPSVSTRIDSEPPVATVNPLPQFTFLPNFTVTWSGSDNLSGIASYTLQMSRNDGDWFDLIADTTATSFQVTGAQFGDKLEFRVRAVDNVGNVQPWSPNAQAVTTIFSYSVALVLPFNPPIIQSNAPVTNVIPVQWVGFFAPGTTIVRFDLSYRYTDLNGATTSWTAVALPTPLTTSIDFDYAALGHGDGLYEFFVQATNNLNQTQPFNPSMGTGGSVILDLADQIQPAAYLPIIHSSIPD
ncbi:MAG TPA: fibronectin type III domain-containing protein [Chloroflexi bacterium]|nr:fibronectin type III domain-containing protein [Chloroflexota bacterium]